MKFFILGLFGLVFGLGAVSVSVPQLESNELSKFFYEFGGLFLLGGMFSSNFSNFVKSSTSRLFKKSEGEGDEYAEDQPPIQKSEGAGGDLESKLDELKMAIESGTVEMTEESIRGWASTNGLTDEDTNFIVDTLIGGGDEMPTEDMEKSGDGDELPFDNEGGEGAEDFEKSMIKYFQGIESKIISQDKKFNNFQKSYNLAMGKIKEKDKEIAFLKSEIGKLSNSPVGLKTPVKESGTTVNSNTRGTVIAKIKKGISLNVCSIDDLMSFEATGKLPENFGLIKE